MKKRFSEITWLDRDKIVVRPELFQNRTSEFSEASVAKIVREGFDTSHEPIVVWLDRDTKKYVILSGHSRWEASRRLYEEGVQPELAKMPVRIFQGDFEEASYFANVESNRLADAEGLLSDLRAFQRARKEGCSGECLKDLFKSSSKIAKLQDLSHLNPKGRFMEALDKEHIGAYPNLELYARWLGRLRQLHPQLENTHENEIFVWLYEGDLKQLPLKEDFYNIITNKVNHVGFNPQNPLKLKESIRKTVYERNADVQIAELQRDIKAWTTRNQQLDSTMQRAISKRNEEGGDLPKQFEEWEKEVTANNRRINETKLQINTIENKVKTLNFQDLDLFAPENLAQIAPEKPKKTDEINTLPADTEKEETDEINDLPADTDKSPEERFVAAIQANIKACERGEGKPHTKPQRAKLGESLGITKQKEVKELTELAIASYTREIATSSDMPFEELYKRVVAIYECQPVISEQDSTSKSAQQYSTPVPIALLAGEYTKTPRTQAVFEPSAGNGLLTVAYPAGMVSVNELDKERLASLRRQGFAQVTNQNAAEPFPTAWHQRFDAVLTNPPFGTTRPINAGNYRLEGLEHLMAHYALACMKDDGRCAIIIGGHSRYDEQGRPTKGKERSFFYYLYTYYHVRDVINIDGAKLYRRQGTSFDIRLILIEGRKKTPKLSLPPVQTEVITSFDALYTRVAPYLYEKNQDLLQSRLDARALSSDDLGNGDTRTSRDNDGARPRDVLGDLPPDASPREHGEEGTNELATRDFGHNPDTEHDAQADSNGGYQFGDGTASNRFDDGSEGMGAGHGDRHLDAKGSRGDLRENESGADARLDEGERGFLPKGLDMDKETAKDVGLVPYKTASQNPAGEKVLIPASMSTEAETAMTRLRKEVGDIDTYVARKLNYSRKELYEYLSNYQIDSVALAIYNIERGEALIIADQTGVGKGRQAAAIIRYGRLQGLAPIFLTQTADLFSDMVRDLRDIGCNDYTPFILNADVTVVDKEGDGKVLFRGMDNKTRQAFITQDNNAIQQSKDLLSSRTNMVQEGYDYILATYSQFNNAKLWDKIAFLGKQAHGNILILDESHNAGGEGATAKYIGGAVKASRGCVFLSATFAKRPDNLVLYAQKTVLRESNLTEAKIKEAFEKGGVALQEVVASQLAQAGQLIRRERSFAGAEVNYITLGANDISVSRRQTRAADGITHIIRQIIAFQNDYVRPIISQLDEMEAKGGNQVEQRKGTEEAGIDNIPFFSRVFNLINQMLFGIKAEDVADLAIRLVREGKSVVIAFNNTMEAALDSLELRTGDVIPSPDFATVLKRGLDSVLKITRTDTYGIKTHEFIPVSTLSSEGQRRYKDILSEISGAATGISLSPIDMFISRMEEAGLRVGEMTGRKRRLRITANGNGVLENRRERNKNETTRKFNAGELDVVVINRSAATGISLHAAKKFANQRRRAMIIAQPQLDINHEVQMRGRVHRVGQVVPPQYFYVASAIPAEQRLMMMLKKKLKSLDANTTGNQKQSAEKVLDAEDFLNKYGDRVVCHYLLDNLLLYDLLDQPIILEAGVYPENAAQKVTGRVAVLSVAEQRRFYEDVETAYNDYVLLLKQQGEYDLEVETLPLDAVLKHSRVKIVGNNGRSNFGKNTVLGNYDIANLRKPFTQKELEEEIAEALNGRTAEEAQASLLERHKIYAEEKRQGIESDVRSRMLRQKEKAIAQKANKLGVLFEDIEGEDLEDLEKIFRETLEATLTEELDKFDATQKWLRNLFTLYKIGYPLHVPLNFNNSEDVQVSNGIFLGFEGGTSQNFVRSKTKARIAVNDGRRLLVIPLSQSSLLDAISSRSYHISLTNAAVRESARVEILGTWGKTSNLARKNAYIITGNVFQAMGDRELNGGRFVDFTVRDKPNEKGILMKDSWRDGDDDNKSHTKPTTRVPIYRALSFIKGLGGGESITTSDGLLTIRRAMGGYMLVLPQAKKNGGEYYMDADLLALVKGGTFEKYANEMRAHVSEGNMEYLVGVLQSKFKQSVDMEADALGDIGQETAPDLPDDWEEKEEESVFDFTKEEEPAEPKPKKDTTKGKKTEKTKPSLAERIANLQEVYEIDQDETILERINNLKLVLEI